MGHNLVDNLSLPFVVVGADLRGQRQFLVVLVGAGDDVQVDARGLAGEDLGTGGLLTEIDGSTVDLIQHDSGNGTVDLELKVGGLDDVDGGDEGVNDEGEAG
jgi:hypothetical protein